VLAFGSLGFGWSHSVGHGQPHNGNRYTAGRPFIVVVMRPAGRLTFVVTVTADYRQKLCR